MNPMRRFARFVAVVIISSGVSGPSAHAQQQPRLTEIRPDGRISWTSETNVSYQLQRVGQLGSGGWAGAGSPVAGNGGIVTVTQGFQGSPQGFYRVVATNNFPCTNGGSAFCASAFSLGSVNGDMDGCRAGPFATGCGDAWFRITVREGNGGQTIDLRVDVALDSSAGANYDLFLRTGCADVPRSSTLGPGMRDQVFYTFTDVDGVNNSRDFWIEVRRATGSPPGTWTLRTSGGTGPCY